MQKYLLYVNIGEYVHIPEVGKALWNKTKIPKS